MTILTIFGNITNSKLKNIVDLNIREICILVPIIIIIFWIGIYPNSFLDPMHGPIEKILNNYHLVNK